MKTQCDLCDMPSYKEFDWKMLSPKEIYAAMKTMPKVAGPWKETSYSSIGQCWEREIWNVDYQSPSYPWRVERCFGSEWWCSRLMCYDTTNKTPEEAMAKTDQTLQEKGWLLVND